MPAEGLNGTRKLLKGLAAFALVLSITGCLGNGAKPPSENDGAEGSFCGEEVEQTYVPIRIDGGKHLRFDPNAFKILSDPKFNVLSVNLYVELETKKPKYEVTVGLNGQMATRSDGSTDFDPDDGKFKGHKRLRLDKYRLNGGEPLANTILRLQLLSAILKITLQGPHIYVKSAALVIRGYYPGPCPTPTPQPTPAPVAPSVSITKVTPAAAMTASTDIHVEFTSDQQGVTFLCSLDGANESACTSPYIRSGLANGEHVFTVRARNAYGLTGPAAEHRWVIDTVPPVVSVTQPASPTNKRSASISFSSTKAGVFKCSLDGADPALCTSPHTVTGLSEGLHTFTVYQTDNIGNVGVPVSVQWWVDLTAPTVQIVATEPSASPSSSNSREISFAASESAKFECSLDSAAFTACESPVRLSGLGEGSHLFEVRATDAAGNTGPVASVSWVTDLTAPVIKLGSIQPAPGHTNASEFKVEFSSNEPAKFFCRIDGDDETECESPLTGSFAEDGRHTVEITAEDYAGLRSTPILVSWIVDREAPEIHFAELLPSSAAYIASNLLEAYVQSPEEVELHAALNGVLLGVVQSPIRLENLAEGTYVLEVVGYDIYGNTTNEIAHAFTVDLTAPALHVTSQYGNGQVVSRTSNSFEFSANEPVEFECELNESGFIPCASPYDVSGLIDGEHVFKVRARDRAGNLSIVTETSWTVDTIAPSTDLTAVQVDDDTYDFMFSSNEPGARFLCSVDGSEPAPCVSPHRLTFDVGSHTFTVYAVDQAGNIDPSGASYSLHVLPAIATSLRHSGVVFTNSTSMTFSFSSNHDDASFLCSLNGAAPEPCVSPMTVSGLANGQHTFLVQAVDRFGRVDPVGASHTWTVDTIAPVIIASDYTTTATTLTVTWALNEAATGRLRWGTGSALNRETEERPAAPSHQIQLTGLSPNTVYSIQITGHDGAGNEYNGPVLQIRTRF